MSVMKRAGHRGGASLLAAEMNRVGHRGSDTGGGPSSSRTIDAISLVDSVASFDRSICFEFRKIGPSLTSRNGFRSQIIASARICQTRRSPGAAKPHIGWGGSAIASIGSAMLAHPAGVTRKAL
jgi:hypothetical protein